MMAKDPKWMYFELARKYAEVNPTDLSRALELMRKNAGPLHERRGHSPPGRPGRGPDGRGPDGRGPGGRDGERSSSSREESDNFGERRRERGPRNGGFGDRERPNPQDRPDSN